MADDEKLNEQNKKAIQQAINELNNRLNVANAKIVEAEKRHALVLREMQQLKQQIAILMATRGSGPTSR